MTTPLLDLLEVGGDPETLADVAAAHFRAAHPGASEPDIRSAAIAVAYYGSDGDVLSGAPSRAAVDRWIARVLDRVDPTDDAVAVALIDALVFLPRPGSADQDVLREVLDLLRQTKHTFKSRQIARAVSLLAPLVDG